MILRQINLENSVEEGYISLGHGPAWLNSYVPESVMPRPTSSAIPPLSEEDDREPLLGSSCESPLWRQMPTGAASFVSIGIGAEFCEERAR